jgi:hypothetical protein
MFNVLFFAELALRTSSANYDQYKELILAIVRSFVISHYWKKILTKLLSMWFVIETITAFYFWHFHSNLMAHAWIFFHFCFIFPTKF